MILETEHEKPTEASCVEYLDRVDADATEEIRELEVRCQESKPIGIAEWPRLSNGCRSEHVKSSNVIDSDLQQSLFAPLEITPNQALNLTLDPLAVLLTRIGQCVNRRST